MICASNWFSSMSVCGGFVQPGGIDPNISCGFLDTLGADWFSANTRREQIYLCCGGLWVQRGRDDRMTVRGRGSYRECFLEVSYSGFPELGLYVRNCFIDYLWSDHLSSCQVCCCHPFQIEDHSCELHQDVEETTEKRKMTLGVRVLLRSTAPNCRLTIPGILEF